jgi:ABC-type glycerol-3-phosphate transport system substrate-binding protein
MWTGSQAEVQAWKYDASLVTKAYPWITIKFLTDAWPDYWVKLPSEMATGSLPDIVSMQSLRTANFSAAVIPLTPYIKSSHFDLSAFDPSIVGGLTYQGSVRALPYDFGPLVVFYNKALFRKYHVPYPSNNWTYAEFLSDARKLTHGTDYGFGANPLIDSWLPFVLSSGANYLNSKGQLNLTDPAVVKAFSNYADLVRKYHVSPHATTANNYYQSTWQAGSIAMILDGPWDLINYKNTTKFDFGIAPVPSQHGKSLTTVAGSGFGISPTSKHPDDAWRAITMLTGPDAEKYLASTGRAYSARKAYQDYWYTHAVPGSKAVLTFALSPAHAVPYRTTPNWQQVNDLTLKYAVAAINGGESPAAALQAIQRQAGGS